MCGTADSEITVGVVGADLLLHGPEQCDGILVSGAYSDPYRI